MARELRYLSAGFHDFDDERLALTVVSEDLKAKPVHRVLLTEEQALSVIADLSKALRTKVRRKR